MKYKLTGNTKEYRGRTLHQIQATKDFSCLKKGDLGGWIEKESNLSQVDDAWVFDNARISGNACISGNTCIFGDARISGNAHIFGNARISENAHISGNACIFGDARISGNAHIFGNARISGNAEFSQGWFVGGGDTGKITNITEQTGSTYWEAQYVIGDYKITPTVEVEEMTMEEVCKALGKTIKIKK